MSTRWSVSAPPRSLLGCHVLGRAEHRSDVGDSRAVLLLAVDRDDLGDAEVDDLDEVAAAVAGDDKDVVGLEVAVNDALFVGRAERLGQLSDDRQDPLGREGRLVLDDLAQGVALDELHDRVRHAVWSRTEVVDVDDIGVADPRRRLGLADESLDHVLIAGHIAFEDLYRHHLLDDDVLGQKHHAHAALAELALDLVAAVQDRADELVVLALDRAQAFEGSGHRRRVEGRDYLDGLALGGRIGRGGVDPRGKRSDLEASSVKGTEPAFLLEEVSALWTLRRHGVGESVALPKGCGKHSGPAPGASASAENRLEPPITRGPSERRR